MNRGLQQGVATVLTQVVVEGDDPAFQLPRVELLKPKTAINRNTVNGMQAGIIYGYVGQVDYILRKMKKELGGKAKVIATGGLANVIAAETEMIDVIDNLLTLQGLYLIYKKNIGESTEEGAKEE